MKRQRGTIFLVPIIIIAIIAVIGAYFLGKQGVSLFPRPTVTNSTPKSLSSSSLDETADWKTYTNEKYGFEFKYPSLWQIDKSSGSSVLLSNKRRQLEISFSDTVDPGARGNECSKKINRKKTILENIPIEIAFFENLNELDECKKLNLDINQIHAFTGFSKDKNMFFVSYLFQKDDKNAEQEFDQILSTFKFLDGNSASPAPTTSTQYSVPSNWKKITCADVGLSLSIPTDWKVSDQGCWLTYWRDAGFAPSRGNIMRVAYKGGSRRDQYIERFNDYGDVKDELVANTLVSEKNINGLDTLLLVPQDPGNHVSVNPAFIFVRNNWLYIFGMSKGEGGDPYFWNDASFMKTYYQIIASFKFLN